MHVLGVYILQGEFHYSYRVCELVYARLPTLSNVHPLTTFMLTARTVCEVYI